MPLRELTVAERTQVAAYIADRDRRSTWFLLACTIFFDVIGVGMAIASWRLERLFALSALLITLGVTAAFVWLSPQLSLAARVYAGPHVTRLRGVMTTRPSVDNSFEYWVGPHQVWLPRAWRRFWGNGVEVELDVARLLSRQTHEQVAVLPLSPPLFPRRGNG